ncbi:IS6 family transposase [Mesorhizobium sp. KR1-2]|uniref:IS6 family transposase n=1 Tax=Mesorhizobium sp. KR1-2 TaxID=3156609 RepID=UPI0032B5FB09
MFKGRQFDQSVILLCVRWYLAYSLSLRDLEEMMAERGIAVDSVGDTIEFWFSEQRDLPSAKQFFRKALAHHGRPDRVVIDGSQTNLEAIASCDTTSRLQTRSRRRLKPIRILKRKYLNNRIEQDHRRIKRSFGPMLGFKSPTSAAIILSGIEMVRMMRKRQAE